MMARIAKWAPVLALLALLLSPADGAAQQDYYTLAEVTEQPGLKSGRQAQRAILRSYPQALQDAGVGGKVQLRFIVDAAGKVEADTIEVVATTVQVLGAAAAEAMAGIEFNPGKKDGSAVRTLVVMPITFGE